MDKDELKKIKDDKAKALKSAKIITK